MKVAYLVSRFPSVTETFVLREFDAVAASDEVDVSLHSLFPGRDSVVHPAAEPWVARVRRPGVRDGAAALAWWLRRRPLRTLGALATVPAAHARRPRILMRALATVPLAAAHARWFRDEGIDHVHAHFATYPTLAAWVAHRLAGTPYSFTPHAHDLFVHQAMLARKAADAAFVVAISEYNRGFLIEHAHPRAIHVIHYGIDPSKFAFRARPTETGEPPRIACVARLLPYKGHAVLLQAVAGAPPPLAGARLDFVGDGPLRASLEEEAARLGLRERVRFHGSVGEPAVAEVLDAADVFALPSIIAPDGDMEGIPNALIEALAAGLPAVSTRQSGVPELIRDGETGYLAEPGDVEGLRGALLRALDDPDAERRAAAGRALVEREFDQRSSARRLVELFTAVSGGAGSSGRSAG